MICTEHIKRVMDRVAFPEDAKECFNKIFERITTDETLNREYCRLLEKYFYTTPAPTLNDILSEIYPLADKYGENILTLHMAFVLSCTPRMYELYCEQGIAEELYWEAMLDLRAKLMECRDCLNINGTFVGPWFDGWFKLERFALGRFQYDPQIYNGEKSIELPCGEILTPGTPIAFLHIPSTGVPLSDEVRNDSYKKAYEFLSERFHTEKVYIWTITWLLYPSHFDFLPQNSNIIRFMKDFHIADSREYSSFSDAWRVFGSYANGPVENYPEDNSLRRAYKKWLSDGNKTGEGTGVILLENGINVTHCLK